MLPHYLPSDDKFPLYTGNSLYSIVRGILPVTINRFGQSAGNHQASFKLDESSETRHGLSNQWLNWVTGFIEADGSFPNVKKSSLSFYISQSTKNAPLIYAIKCWLGFGKVRLQHSENMVHYIIEDIPNLVRLANLVNGRFRTEHKYEAYVKFVNRLNEKNLVKNKIIIKPLNSKLDYNWLAGFTEGDGSFFINLGKTPKSKLGVQLALNISWTQKHKKTLDLIASEFKGGFSYNQSNKFWILNIKRQSEIKKLLLSVFVDNPLYGIKRHDYLDLKVACELFNTKQHLTQSGLELLLKIRSTMNARRII